MPAYKHAYSLFRSTRLSNAQHSCTVLPIAYKRSMSIQRTHKNRKQKAEAVDPSALTLLDDDELSELRLSVKTRVENTIRNRFGSMFRVEFFGSIRYGVSHANSDLDLVVIDPNMPQGPNKKLHTQGAIYNIRDVARTLGRAGYTDIDCRAHAAVPIVKFHDPRSGLDCDLNINDRLGMLNSAMIKEYCDIHPLLRPLLSRIKEWAKPLGLNNPSPPRGPKSFSSYALSLMTISFLQKEGQLPNLQDNLPPLSKSEGKKRFIWTRKPPQCWDVRFHSAKDWVVPPLPDFDALLRSWFSFWIKFPYESQSISIRDGGIVPRVIPVQSTSKKKEEKTTTASYRSDIRHGSIYCDQECDQFHLDPDACSVQS